MSVAVAVTVLFWVSVATLAIGLARRARLWRTGREAPVEWTGLLAVPKRYFVDLHHVVARDPYIANTHIATAGGAFAALVLVAINYGLGLYSPATRLGNSARRNRHADRRILCLAEAASSAATAVWRRLEQVALYISCVRAWACSSDVDPASNTIARIAIAALAASACRIGGTCARHRRGRSDEACGRRAVASRIPSPARALRRHAIDRAVAVGIEQSRFRRA